MVFSLATKREDRLPLIFLNVLLLICLSIEYNNYKSNVTDTDYFIIFLQNVDVTNILLVFI